MFKHVKNPGWKIGTPEILNEICTTYGRSCQGSKNEFKKHLFFFFLKKMMPQYLRKEVYALQISENRREAEGKGEKERYIHLNEEFQSKER